MTWEKILCAFSTLCDFCLVGIYPGERYHTTPDRRRRVCSVACMRDLTEREAQRDNRKH
jgi:hypothetical protein